MARGRVGETPRGSNFGNSCTKILVYYLFIRESDELVQAFLSSYGVDLGIR